MEFEKAYAAYKNGTATEEEIRFVESEITKARLVESVLDAKPIVPVAKAEAAVVKKARKEFNLRSIANAVVAVAVILLLAAGTICGGIFGTAVSSAKKHQNYNEAAAKELAIEFADAYVSEDVSFYVTEVEREIKYAANLARSSYVYYISVQAGTIGEVEVIVDAKSGEVTLEEFDRD